MGFGGIYAGAATVASQPDPNTLGVIDPYPEPYVNLITPSAAWVAQGKHALVSFGNFSSGLVAPIRLGFVPSVPLATYTVAIWEYDDTTNVWLLRSKPDPGLGDGSFWTSYPPAGVTPAENNFSDIIVNPIDTPIYIEVVALSAGTLQILHDSGAARTI